MIDWIIKNKEWLFSGLGVAIISYVVALVRKGSKKNKKEPLASTNGRTIGINNGINIGDNANISGNIAGGDINIFNNSFQEKTNELIEILNHRADLITNELGKYYKYIKIQNYIGQFSNLHKQHIEALKKGNIIYSHEILSKIHKLSYAIEHDEFWTKHKIKTPNAHYFLRGDVFKRGLLICAYIAGDMVKYSPKYPINRYKNFEVKLEEKKIIELYEKIYKSAH